MSDWGLFEWFGGTGHAGGEILYWCSQIALACIAAVAALFANNQVKTFKLLELLKYLEQPHVREARRMVRTKIEPLTTKGDDWWNQAEDLEAAASIVCASFNTTAGVLRLGWSRTLPRYFARHWGQSIIANYEILEPLIKSRRTKSGDGDYMADFEWIYLLAKKQLPDLVPDYWKSTVATPLQHQPVKSL